MNLIERTQKRAKLADYRRWKPSLRKAANKLEHVFHLQQLTEYYNYRAKTTKSARAHEAFVRKAIKSYIEHQLIQILGYKNRQKTRLRALRASKQEMKHHYKGQA